MNGYWSGHTWNRKWITCAYPAQIFHGCSLRRNSFTIQHCLKAPAKKSRQGNVSKCRRQRVRFSLSFPSQLLSSPFATYHPKEFLKVSWVTHGVRGCGDAQHPRPPPRPVAPRLPGKQVAPRRAALPAAGTALTPRLEEHHKGRRHFVREIPISALSSPC